MFKLLDRTKVSQNSNYILSVHVLYENWLVNGLNGQEIVSMANYCNQVYIFLVSIGLFRPGFCSWL